MDGTYRPCMLHLRFIGRTRLKERENGSCLAEKVKSHFFRSKTMLNLYSTKTTYRGVDYDIEQPQNNTEVKEFTLTYRGMKFTKKVEVVK